MIRLCINSKFGKNIRREKKKKILDSLERRSFGYCCNIRHGYNLLICWKNLKEVKENMNSIHLASEIRNNRKLQNCGYSWFDSRECRIAFIKECLNKLK